MFKFINKSLPLLFNTKIFTLFSQQRQQILLLSRQLLSNHQNYKPWKNIRLIHAITMSRYQPQIKDQKNSVQREQQTKIQAIIDSLSGQLHQIPHRQINMLLQVLRQRGYKYDRNIPIFRALSKHAKLFFGKQYKGEQFTKSLVLYKSLNFPKQTRIKMIQCFVKIDQQRYKKQQNLRISSSQFFKLAMLVLQQPYIHLTLTKSIVQQLTKINANNLQALTSLYHICIILPKSLKVKVDFQFATSNVRDILFNPYSQTDQNAQSQSQQNQSNQSNQQLKTRLEQISNQIQKLFFSSVDVSKLQQTITKIVQSDLQPLNKQNILFASDISQLKPYILTFLHQNLQKLTPIQFIHLLRKTPQAASSLIPSYYKKLQKYMSINEKIFMHLETHRFFHTPIEINYIKAIIQSIQDLQYDQFIGITRMVAELPPSSQKEIPDLLALIKKKLKQ